MANSNSYTENLKNLTKSVNEAIAIANAVNEAATGKSQSVTIDGSTMMFSTTNITNRLSRLENTIKVFTDGNGTIETNDGTFRKISMTPVSKPPKNIVTDNLEFGNNFTINPNWFFESLQFPRCVVEIDLGGQIDEDSDRVYVDRIMIDTHSVTDEQKTALLNGLMTYEETIDYLSPKTSEDAGIPFREDKDEIKLPLTYEKFRGTFQVMSIDIDRSDQANVNKKYYTLNTIEYNEVDENGNVIGSTRHLQRGDKLRYKNSVYEIDEIDIEGKRIHTSYTSGYESISVYDSFGFYNNPFSEKKISVGIGIDEIDLIFIKGVNEEYNLMSEKWSLPIAFETNTLTFDNGSTLFENYYWGKVFDFGKMLIAQAKEQRIPAYGYSTPNVPVLDANKFKVVQINTQLNTTIDNEEYTRLTQNITNTRSAIESKSVDIRSDQEAILTETDQNKRREILSRIESNTSELGTLNSQLSSSIASLQTLMTNSGALKYSPKYHIRGLLDIPASQYTLPASQLGEQKIIGFEILYQYIRTNSTETSQEQYNYDDGDTSVETGFKNWNVAYTPLLEKVYDADSDTFVWKESSDLQFNQVDIPISQGERVKFKVRSISEAGYPYCPLKSEWSNVIEMGFPDNLTTTAINENLLDTLNRDVIATTTENVMTSRGVYAHLSDSNAQYRHDATKIQFIDTTVDATSGATVQSIMSVSDKIAAMMAKITELEQKINNSQSGN